MAKNRYKEYTFTGTFACGHKEEITQGGYTEEYAEEKAQERFKGLCPDCEREKQLEIAKSDSTESGYPELKGTPKQVAWAETLRYEYKESVLNQINEIDEYFLRRNPSIQGFYVDKYEILKGILEEKRKERKALLDEWKLDASEEVNEIYEKKIEALVEDVRVYLTKMLEKTLRKIDSAVYFIDNRNNIKTFAMLDFAEDNIIMDDKEEKIQEEVEKELSNEQIAMPDNYNYSNVMILQKDDIIKVYSDKDQVIIDTVKAKGYKWNGHVWERKIDKYNGPIDDRIIELGNCLLSKGYLVRFKCKNYKDIIPHAVKGEFKPEIKRWIGYNENKNVFIADFPRNDELYSDVCKIKGMKWDSVYGVMIPGDRFKEVQDFAEINGFTLTEEAEKRIERLNNFVEKNKQKITEKELKEAEKMIETPDIDETLKDLKDD